MKTKSTSRDSAIRGFTLLEALVSLSLSGLVLFGVSASAWLCLSKWRTAEMFLRVSYESGNGLQEMIHGPHGGGGLREASSMAVAYGSNGWNLVYHDADGVERRYEYRSDKGQLLCFPGEIEICSDLVGANVYSNAAGNGAFLELAVERQEGRFAWANSASTFVVFRNSH